MSARITLCVAVIALLSSAGVAHAQSFDPPGALVAGSGRGRVDETVWAPTMRFPMEYGPAYANSQVYAPGGSMPPSGRGGGQCDSYNYGYPWRDNFCETRRWDVALCPSGHGHQGQDIRPGVCTSGVVPGVAAAAGRIADIGSYSVDLVADDGTRYEYLHMNRVAVREGQRVECGDVLGYISNAFGGTPTTIHLHFNIRMAVRGVGSAFVPPYTSLRESYGRLGAGDACAPPMDAGVRDAGTRDAGRTDAGRTDAGRRDAGTSPSSGMCRSTTLGRNVSDGECVQVGAAVASCGTGCGWARCDAGAWTCISDLSTCGGTTHANGECDPVGGTCRSDTLGRNVEHGTCVQVTRASCGESSCAWYRCVDGNWACTELTACSGESVANASCDNVCVGTRGVCGDRLECCGGRTNSNIECFEGYCEDTTMCLPNGDTSCGTTVPDGTGLPHCCGPMICGLDTGGTPECCGVPGEPCTSADDCCGFEQCTDGMCAPQETGESCMNTQECVGADYCTDSGVCGTD